MDMSEEDRETRTRLISQLWALYRDDVVAARELENGSVQAFTDDFLANVEAAGGDIATAALNSGLVDALLTRTQVRDLLIDYVGEDPDNPDTFSAAGMYEYLAHRREGECGGYRRGGRYPFWQPAPRNDRRRLDCGVVARGAQ